jgi:histidine ammonia-lyase
MITQVTAAALAEREQVHWPTPASVTSLPTSGQSGGPREHGHVRRAAAARRWCSNTATIVGIEAMSAACQGIELKRDHAHPVQSSPLVEAEWSPPSVRSVAFIEQDRYLAPDIEAMRRWALRPPAEGCAPLRLLAERGALNSRTQRTKRSRRGCKRPAKKLS